MKTNKLDIEQALFKDKVINKLAIVDYVKEFEKENQELKEKLETKTHFLTLEEKRVSNLMKLVNEQQDKILKVVESVLDCHIHMNDKCSCGWESETDTFNEHLLQEIKSAIEKGKE